MARNHRTESVQQALSELDQHKLVCALTGIVPSPLTLLKFDPTIANIVERRASEIASLNWSISPYDDLPESRGIAEFCKRVIRDIPRLRNSLRKMAHVFWTGFAVAEVIWEIADNGVVVVTELCDRHPNRFKFGADGTLKYRPSASSINYLDAPPQKFLVLQYNTIGENPYGTPLSECVFELWRSKFNIGRGFEPAMSKLRYYDHAIEKVILGNSDSQICLCELLESALNQLICWLVDFNFPNATGYPKCDFLLDAHESRTAAANWFRLRGDVWEIGFESTEIGKFPTSMTGFEYIYWLLSNPGRQFAPIELYRAIAPSAPGEIKREHVDETNLVISEYSEFALDPPADQRAIREAQKRLEDCRAMIGLSETPIEEREMLESEIQKLANYLNSVTRVGRSPRPTEGLPARMRKTVRQAVKRAIVRIRNQKNKSAELLADHLETSIMYNPTITYMHFPDRDWQT